MKLLLLRHGEAEPEAASDSARALSIIGRNEVKTMAEKNSAALKAVDHIFVSPYLRAQQTADIVETQIQASRSDTDLLIPGASVNLLIDFLYKQSESYQCVLLVAHNPLLEALLDALGGFEYGSYRMRTASLAQFECDILARDCCSLDWLHHP